MAFFPAAWNQPGNRGALPPDSREEVGMNLADGMLEELRQSIVDMEDQKAVAWTRKALEHYPAEQILNAALIPAMETVGVEYEQGKKFIPEMLLASEAMTAALELLKPQLARSDVKKAGKVVMGTVEGDVHDIGQRMVCIMLEGAGFEVVSLGADVPTDEFVNAVKTGKPDILGMSALLTTTAPGMKKVIDALESQGLRARLKVMVGGAILNQRLAEEFGADGYAPDASSAARLAKILIETRYP
jgi:5-methyltetrahydrofolate--homocysteine methyltransferase